MKQTNLVNGIDPYQHIGTVARQQCRSQRSRMEIGKRMHTTFDIEAGRRRGETVDEWLKRMRKEAAEIAGSIKAQPEIRRAAVARRAQ